MRKAPISLMAFPRQGDSYTDCFYPAVESLGANIREGVFAGRWLLKNLHGADYVHLHWPSFFYNRDRRSKSLRAYGLFLFFLALLHLRGARVIWTVHNLYPHDRSVIPQFDRLTRRLLVRIAARLLVHGPSAAAQVCNTFPAAAPKITLIDHGHWVGYYPDVVSRDEARAKLGLAEDAYVFLFAGACKPYKNLEGLVAAFAHLPDKARLVVAGRFQSRDYRAKIEGLIGALRRPVLFHPQYVADHELQIYLRASDAVVLPYNEILTSGSAMLALSFGRPVIAPAIGFLKDTITPECGRLYDPREPDGLRRAMEDVMTIGFDPSVITSCALSHDWVKSAQAFLDGLPTP